MHELSIAESIVRIAQTHAGGRPVHAVDVRIGHLRQVVPDSLAFAFELLSSGTALDGAQLRLETVAAAVRCRGCGAETEQDAFPLCCGACGAFDVEVVRGEELLVDAIELEEPMTTTGRNHGG